MNHLLRRIGRWVPRSLRNHLKAPQQSLRWWLSSRRPAITCSPGYDWSFRAPELAVKSAFHLQTDDPPQAAEFAEFMALIKGFQDPLFFDIGCHFGIFSFAVVDRCGPGAQAVAIDPSSTACEMVRRISKLNGWTDRVEVLQMAMGDRIGDLEMVDGGVVCAGYFMLPGDQPKRDRVVVPQQTIDGLAHQRGRSPDLVKIDVEGFELEVLMGGRATLVSGDIPLCLEVHNHYLRERNVDPRSILRTLEEFGYRQLTCGGRAISPEDILIGDIVRVVARK